MRKICIIHGALNIEKFSNFIRLPQRTIGNDIGCEYISFSCACFIYTVNHSFSDNSVSNSKQKFKYDNLLN